MEYELLICPVCGRQGDEGGYEYGPSTVCEHNIDPITVDAAIVLDPARLRSLLGLGCFRYEQEQLADQIAREDRRARERELDAMTDAELREELGPMGYTMRMMMKASIERMRRDNERYEQFRNFWKSGETVTVPIEQGTATP